MLLSVIAQAFITVKEGHTEHTHCSDFIVKYRSDACAFVLPPASEKLNPNPDIWI